jgi:methionyl-tRNA synthetase
MSNQSITGPIYVTTTIPFVNARPHVGYAFELVLADATARYLRARGHDVRFQSGTDDNSLKNVRAAQAEGVSTRDLVRGNAARFRELGVVLGLSIDDFVETSIDERHKACVEALWTACAKRGDIYKKPYRGLYCVGCEQFYTESELDDGLCPDHRTLPEVVEEENYFFRLERYSRDIHDWIASERVTIAPAVYRNEVLSFIRSGLTDFSISRSRTRAGDWGLPVPGDPSSIIYVWFDALCNYLSGLGYADHGALYTRYWEHAERRIHFLGKGVTRFHCVYWPAILLSAGAPLPTEIDVHGYLTVEGVKISKSLGNGLDPSTLVERFGRDTLRYYLLRHFRPGQDGDFSLERLALAHDRELADQLGNLVSRTLGLLDRYRAGVVPTPGLLEPLDEHLSEEASTLPARVEASIVKSLPHAALDALFGFFETVNKYITDAAPWEWAKRRDRSANAHDRAAAELRLSTILYLLTESVRIGAHLLAPFLPETSAEILRQLGIAPQVDEIGLGASTPFGKYPPQFVTNRGKILFPKSA